MTKLTHGVARRGHGRHAGPMLDDVLMRRLRLPLLCACGLAALAYALPAGAASPTPSASPSTSPSASPSPSAAPNPVVAALEQQAATLEQQIMALQLQSAPLQFEAVQAQQRAAAAQTQLAQMQLQLADANVALARTTASLQTVQAKLADDRARLGRLLFAKYVTTASNTALVTLINSQDLNQTIDTLVRYSQVTDSMTTLVEDVRTQSDQLAALHSSEADEQQQIQQQVSTVENMQSQAQEDQAAFQAKAAHLTGPAARLTQQLQGVLAQLAAAQGQDVATVGAGGTATGTIDGALPPFAFGPRVDDFPWGQCTWYVASLRDVTWGGDAWQWIADAAKQNTPTGMTPKPGAIVVFAPGNGSSPVGHVAYVETVVSPTSFIVDEANVLGLGVVDKRLVGSLSNVEGFIY